MVRWQSPGSDEELAAKEEFEQALERYASIRHGRPVMLEGYIVQVSSNAMDGEGDQLLNTMAKTGQSSVLSMGLLAFIQDNVSEFAFGGWSEAEEDD